MIVGMKVNSIFVRVIGSNRFRLLVALSESAAEYIVGNHQFVPGHFRSLRVDLGIDVDQLDHPIAVGAGSRCEQVCNEVAGNNYVLTERLGVPAQNSGSI